MTEFASIADLLADYERRRDSIDAAIRKQLQNVEQLSSDLRAMEFGIETLHRVKALPADPADLAAAGRAALQEIAGAWLGSADSKESLHTEPPPRQRQDVRGPVLALIGNSSTELSLDEICRLLPDLKDGSIRAALRALVASMQIKESGGLYCLAAVEQPSREDREDDPRWAYVRATTPMGQLTYRETLTEAGFSDSEIASLEAEATTNHRIEIDDPTAKFHFPSRARRAPGDSDPPAPAEPQPGTDEGGRLVVDETQKPPPFQTVQVAGRSLFAHEREPDTRAITDTSPEAQAASLRAAIEHAGPAGLDEENACVDPLVIAAGIEAGWLRRTTDDRGARLWIAEREAAK